MSIMLYIIIAVLATSAILEAWFHEDGIFENSRNKLSLWLLEINFSTLGTRIGSFLVQLINCRKCLTYWVSTGSVLLILISRLSVYTTFILYIFIILAVARGVHLIDDYLASKVMYESVDDEE